MTSALLEFDAEVHPSGGKQDAMDQACGEWQAGAVIAGRIDGFDFTHLMMMSCLHANVLSHAAMRTGERRIFRAFFYAVIAQSVWESPAGGSHRLVRPEVIVLDDIACLVWAYFRRVWVDHGDALLTLLRQICPSLHNIAFEDGLGDMTAPRQRNMTRGRSDGADEGGLDSAVAADVDDSESLPPGGFRVVLSTFCFHSVVLRVAVPVMHAKAHRCQFCLGAGSAPHVGACAEFSEWVNAMAGLGPRAGALRNASAMRYRTGWAATFTMYNARRNGAAPEWLLSQLGFALARGRAASVAYNAASLGGHRDLESELDRLSHMLAVEAAEGLEGGGRARASGAPDAVAAWVAAAEQHDALSRALEHADAAGTSARHQHVTRNLARDQAKVDEAVATAWAWVLSHSPAAARVLARYAGARKRSKLPVLDTIDHARELLPKLRAKLDKVPALHGNFQAIFVSVYERAFSLALRATCVKERLTPEGRLLSGERGAKADECLIRRHFGDLERQLVVLRVLCPRVPDVTRAGWTPPATALGACADVDAAFPSEIGSLRFSRRGRLHTLLDLRSRAQRLDEHVDIITGDITDACLNQQHVVEQLRRELVALTACPSPSLLAGLARSGIVWADECPPDSPVLFGSSLETLSPTDTSSFARAGASIVYAGLQIAEELLARFQRLALAVGSLPPAFELPTVGKRLQWQRLGPGMLRGTRPLSVWLAACAPAVGAAREAWIPDGVDEDDVMDIDSSLDDTGDAEAAHVLVDSEEIEEVVEP